MTNTIESMCKQDDYTNINKYLSNISIINLTKIIIEYIFTHEIEFNNLECVICSYKYITDEQLMIIPKTITKLNVCMCIKLTNNSIKYFTNLTHLNIASTWITDDALINVNLIYFNCANTRITCYGIEHMTNLKIFNFDYTIMKNIDISKFDYVSYKRCSVVNSKNCKIGNFNDIISMF